MNILLLEMSIPILRGVIFYRVFNDAWTGALEERIEDGGVLPPSPSHFCLHERQYVGIVIDRGTSRDFLRISCEFFFDRIIDRFNRIRGALNVVTMSRLRGGILKAQKYREDIRISVHFQLIVGDTVSR